MEATVSTSYLEEVLNIECLPATIQRVSGILNDIDSNSEFDAIAFCGMSGAILAGAVANTVGKHLIMVRNTSLHHSSMVVEGLQRTDKERFNYIIVDDLIESARTIQHIVAKIDEFTNGAGKCTGIVLYADDRDEQDIWEEVGYLEDAKNRLVRIKNLCGGELPKVFSAV